MDVCSCLCLLPVCSLEALGKAAPSPSGSSLLIAVHNLQGRGVFEAMGRMLARCSLTIY